MFGIGRKEAALSLPTEKIDGHRLTLQSVIARGSAREKYHQRVLGHLYRGLDPGRAIHQAHPLPRERRPAFALHTSDLAWLVSYLPRLPSWAPVRQSSHCPNRR